MMTMRPYTTASLVHQIGLIRADDFLLRLGGDSQHLLDAHRSVARFSVIAPDTS